MHPRARLRALRFSPAARPSAAPRRPMTARRWGRGLQVTIERMGDAVAESTALGRLGGAGDAAGTCLWLASRAGAYVTGAVVVLDGGSTVKGPAASL